MSNIDSKLPDLLDKSKEFKRKAWDYGNSDTSPIIMNKYHYNDYFNIRSHLW